mmetsp:Transcript_30389/g.48692  ORF Transcript_30389/g.48692 Transcript_30389/m.48692 type:complete len:272 (+) Transcript_30389:395-1210(+)
MLDFGAVSSHFFARRLAIMAACPRLAAACTGPAGMPSVGIVLPSILLAFLKNCRTPDFGAPYLAGTLESLAMRLSAKGKGSKMDGRMGCREPIILIFFCLSRVRACLDFNVDAAFRRKSTLWSRCLANVILALPANTAPRAKYSVSDISPFLLATAVISAWSFLTMLRPDLSRATRTIMPRAYLWISVAAVRKVFSQCLTTAPCQRRCTVRVECSICLARRFHRVVLQLCWIFSAADSCRQIRKDSRSPRQKRWMQTAGATRLFFFPWFLK